MALPTTALVLAAIALAVLWFCKRILNVRVFARKSYRPGVGTGRPLGLLETWYAAQDRRVFCIAVEVAGSTPSHNDMCRAAAFAVDAHPLLSMVLANRRSGDPTFAPVDNITNAIRSACVCHPDARPLEQSISEALNHHFDVGSHQECLWRLTAAPTAGTKGNFHLVLLLQHTISDGRSSVVFMQDIIRGFGTLGIQVNVKGGDATKSNNAKPTKDIALPLDHYVDLRPSLVAVLHAIGTLVLPRIFTNTRGLSVLPREQRYDESERPTSVPALEESLPFRTSVSLLTVSAADVSRLLAQSRREGTTIQGAVVSAAIFAFAKLVARGDYGQLRSTSLGYFGVRDLKPSDVTSSDGRGFWLSYESAVSLRALGERATPETDVGLYISSVVRDANINHKRSYWELAREAKDAIGRYLPIGIQKVGLLQVLGKNIHGFVDKTAQTLPNARSGVLGVTNLGNAQLSSCGPVSSGQAARESWDVNSLIFCNSMVCQNPLLAVSVVTLAGEMRCTVCYATPLMDEPRARAFKEYFNAALLQAASASEPQPMTMASFCKQSSS